MPEVFAIDLDEELISHLANPDSVRYLWAEEIDPDLIEDEFALQVFQWQFNHLHEYSKPATASVLADEFDLELAEPLTVIEDLLERMRDRWVRNHAREHMEEISEAYKEDPAKVIQVLPVVARNITKKVGKRGEAYGTGDYNRAMHRYDELVLRGPGGSFGFDEVDQHFHSMKGLTFGIAPPKTYKSWIYGANVIVKNVIAGRSGKIYSLELPADETYMRIICLAAGVPYWRYLRMSLSATDKAALKEAADLLDSMGVHSAAKPEIGHRTIEEMVERAGDEGADFVVIDQLQYVETQNGKQLGGADGPNHYWQPLNAARDLSDKIPILIIHQFNRSVMNAEKMPEMQQAKGAAAIEEVATLALGLWANKDMRRSNVVELGTLASRHYQYESWEIGVNLSRSCDFELLGRVDHDE
jgi:hypothetical protein